MNSADIFMGGIFIWPQSIKGFPHDFCLLIYFCCKGGIKFHLGGTDTLPYHMLINPCTILVPMNIYFFRYRLYILVNLEEADY